MILEMFLRYSSASGADDRAQRAAAYAGDLSPFPAWAIAKAIASRPASPFAPSSIELVDAARAAIAPFNVELAQIRKVLAAEVEQDDQMDRASISEGLRRVAEDIRADSTEDLIKSGGWRKLPPAQWPREVAERALEESREIVGEQELRISPRLRDAINRRNAETGRPLLPVPEDDHDDYLRSVLR